MRCALRVSFEPTNESDVCVFERRLAYRDAPYLSRGDHRDERSDRTFCDACLYPQDLAKLALLDHDRVDKLEPAQPIDGRGVDPEHLELHHAQIAHIRLEVCRGSERDGPALVDDRDPVAELVRLEEIVRGEDDRGAALVQLLMIRRSSRAPIGSSPMVGSSRKSTRGLCRS